MLKAPKYEIDMDNQKVWLRLSLGDNGEVNHFLDALLIKAQVHQDMNLMSFCGQLKSHERFYKNDLVTDFDLSHLNQFLDLLTTFVDITDPYELGTVKPRSRQASNENVVDGDVVDTGDQDSEGDGEL